MRDVSWMIGIHVLTTVELEVLELFCNDGISYV